MIGEQRGENVIETVIMQVQLEAGFFNKKIPEQDTTCIAKLYTIKATVTAQAG
jgi:hypothetical protein